MSLLLKTILTAVVILTFALAGLAIAVLVRKNGKFPDTHIHSNKYLREKDIHCAHKEDNLEQMKAREKNIFRNLKYIKRTGE